MLKTLNNFQTNKKEWINISAKNNLFNHFAPSQNQLVDVRRENLD